MSELNQRHQLVLLFTDLTDSTRIAARLEPEHYADLLSQLRHHTSTIVARHGGEVVRVDGDGALCIFGYPLAHEDAGRRATEAALDLHAAVAELAGDTAVSLHSGIHAGVVLLRSGDLVRGRYEMLGDATNVAARLCDAAGPGGILVSAETLGTDRHFFQCGTERAIALSGHLEPMLALPILARNDVPHRFAARELRGLSPFVGRAPERTALLEWLSAPNQAAPVMLLHGPAGIGKSRLLKVISSEFGDGGWSVVRGYCEGYLGAPPLQPLLQIAASLSTDLGPEPDVAAKIGEIIHTSAAQPLLLAIDDWQWADDASRNIITQLARACPPTLRLLLLSREGDAALPPDCEVASIALGPLDGQAARATIATLLTARDPFVVAQIEAATGGSPLLIEELCHTFATKGSVASSSKLREAWFDLSVQSRFAYLASDDAGLLRLAAVIGNSVPPWLLAAVWGRAIDGGMVRRLQDADFLYPGDNGDRLQFKHGLTRDAVYAAIGLSERKALHARVLEALEDRAAQSEGEPFLDGLAYHSLEAGLSAKGLDYAMAAGDAAMTAGALDRVGAHYLAAFDLIEKGERTPERLAKLRQILRTFGRACVVDPDRSHVAPLERILRCAEDFRDEGLIALATYWIGAHYYGLGEARRSLATLERSLKSAETLGAETLITQIHANLGQSNAIAGHYRRARHHMDLAIASKLASRKPGTASSSLAYCLSSRGLMLADMGEFAGAFADFDRSIEAMAGTRDPMLASLETQRCLALIYQGSLAEAVERAEASEHLAVRSHARFLVYSSRALGGFAQWQLSGDQSQFDRFVEATIILHRSDRFQRISYKYGWIAEVMAGRGAAGPARLFASLAFRRALKGDRLGEASAARALARLAAGSGDERGIGHYLKLAERAARARLSTREEALNHACAANCWSVVGNAFAAHQAAKERDMLFAELGMPLWRERLAE